MPMSAIMEITSCTGKSFRLGLGCACLQEVFCLVPFGLCFTGLFLWDSDFVWISYEVFFKCQFLGSGLVHAHGNFVLIDSGYGRFFLGGGRGEGFGSCVKKPKTITLIEK